MLLAENATSLLVFALWLVAFVIGYALRKFTDEARAEFTATIAYRQRQARKRAAYRRLNDGRN